MTFLKYLPKALRIYLIRRVIRIPVAPKNLTVSIAKTKEDLEKAYKLLHDCYVKTKLMNPDPSGLRCTFFGFLPTTTVIVAKIGDEVVGTTSLIRDSNAGLPSDEYFKNQNDILRDEGHRLVEVASLATDPKFRKNKNCISLYLMKYLQHYATHYMGCTTVSSVVHPRACDFYKAFWDFKVGQEIVKIRLVNGALGAHVYGRITDDEVLRCQPYFVKNEIANPMLFLQKKLDNLFYPKRNLSNLSDPVFTPSLLRYFMAERTRFICQVTYLEMKKLYNAYNIYFQNLTEDHFFKLIETEEVRPRAHRYPTNITAKIIRPGETPIEGVITDISAHGVRFSTNAPSLHLQQEYILEFVLEYTHNAPPEKISVAVIPKRLDSFASRSKSPNPRNYGVQFKIPELSIGRFIRTNHLNISEKESKKIAN